MKSLKTSNKLNKMTDADDQDNDSPSLIKTKKCIDMEPPASQIQVTIWKEDNASQAAPSSSLRGSKSRSVNSNNRNANSAGFADRIISASRASNVHSKR